MRINKTIYSWIWIRAESERLRALSPKWNVFIIPFPSELRDKVGRIWMILRKQCLPDTVGLTHMWIQRTCAIICKTCTCSSQMGSLCWERKQTWTSIPIKSAFADDDHSHGGGSVFPTEHLWVCWLHCGPGSMTRSGRSAQDETLWFFCGFSLLCWIFFLFYWSFGFLFWLFYFCKFVGFGFFFFVHFWSLIFQSGGQLIK